MTGYLPYCTWAPVDHACGAFTISGGGGHVNVVSCRCIQGYPGGCNSYLDQTPPACPTLGQACTSAPNTCGMTNSGTINSSCVCSATAPSDNLCHTPVGQLEGNPPFLSVTLKQMCTQLTGWAVDTDYAGSIPVEVYDNGALISTLTANLNRPDIGALYPGHNASGFAFPTTNLTRGVLHKIQTYGINVAINGTRTIGPHPELSGSPLWLTCPPPPTISISGVPPSINQGQTTTIHWTTTNAVSCTATGGDASWAGARGISGDYPTPALLGDTTYGLTCVNALGESTSASTTVTVILQPPTITSIKQPDYCSSATLSATVAWSALTNNDFQVQAARDSAFTFLTYDSKNPLVQATQPWWKRLLHWFGAGDEAQAAVSGSQMIPSSKLAYGQKYYVRVRVRTGPAAPWSPWSPNVIALPGTLTWFNTPSIAYPAIKLSVTPTKPIAKQEATFSDDTDYKGDAIINRTWDFGDGTVVTEPPPPISGNTMKHTYASEASVTAILSVQTASMPVNKPCSSAPLMLNVGKAIPIFKEVRP